MQARASSLVRQRYVAGPALAPHERGRFSESVRATTEQSDGHREEISGRNKSSIVSRRRMTFTDLPSTSASAGRSRVL
jgi:hypothetical protein